jgi:hypothetical protein
MFKKKSQRTAKTTTGRVFSTKLTTLGVFFAAAIKGKIEEQRQLPARKVLVAAPARMEPRTPAPLLQQNEQPTSQSVWAPNVNSQPLDNILRVVTVVQQVMTEFNDAVSEEDKIAITTKIVLNLI